MKGFVEVVKDLILSSQNCVITSNCRYVADLVPQRFVTKVDSLYQHYVGHCLQVEYS
jgi:hypothetical protein